jgi:hypothetical protein
MKATIGILCCFLFACLLDAPERAVAQDEKRKTERFSALGYMPSGAGRRGVGAGNTATVDLYIKDYTSDQEAKALAALLLEGGSDALLKALEKSDSKGNVTLTGHVSFYDLKLIRSRATETGRQIIAVGDRPVRFLEAYFSGRSRDYEFGILILNLERDKKGKEKGQGTLIYAAKVKVIDGSKIEIENYGIDPVRLMSVRKL